MRVFRLRFPRGSSAAGRWIGITGAGMVSVADVSLAAVWESWESAELVADALFHNEGWELEIVEGTK